METCQTITLPWYGTYKMECWGANGGPKPQASGSSTPGIGGYTSGLLTLKSTLYVYVGGVGTNAYVRNNNPGGWNGGGYGGSNKSASYEDAGSGGGGSSDIRLLEGTWNSAASLKARIMVAAGGGGCCYATHTSSNNSGGAGGGLKGESGKSNNATYGASNYENTGGEQTKTGTDGSGDKLLGAFGYANQTVLTGSASYGGGGGGGWYGGVKGYGRRLMGVFNEMGGCTRGDPEATRLRLLLARSFVARLDAGERMGLVVRQGTGRKFREERNRKAREYNARPERRRIANERAKIYRARLREENPEEFARQAERHKAYAKEWNKRRKEKKAQ